MVFVELETTLPRPRMRNCLISANDTRFTRTNSALRLRPCGHHTDIVFNNCLRKAIHRHRTEYTLSLAKPRDAVINFSKELIISHTICPQNVQNDTMRHHTIGLPCDTDIALNNWHTPACRDGTGSPGHGSVRKTRCLTRF